MGLDQYIGTAPYNAVFNQYGHIQEIHYFRKFNALHKWVCDNCELPDGEDNCVFIPINLGQWRKLYKITGKILAAYDEGKDWNDEPDDASVQLACRLFPTTSGFFFGDLDYNNWYFDDLRKLRDVVWSSILECHQDLPDEWNGDPEPIRVSDEAAEAVRANKKAIDDLDKDLNKAYSDIVRELCAQYKVERKYDLDESAREKFDRELEQHIEAWKKVHGYDAVPEDPYEGTGISMEDCCTHEVYGYYAWY